MTSIHDSDHIDGVPTYVQGGDPTGRFTDYYPAWLDNLADDVTIEWRADWLRRAGNQQRRRSDSARRGELQAT